MSHGMACVSMASVHARAREVDMDQRSPTQYTLTPTHTQDGPRVGGRAMKKRGARE